MFALNEEQNAWFVKPRSRANLLASKCALRFMSSIRSSITTIVSRELESMRSLLAADKIPTIFTEYLLNQHDEQGTYEEHHYRK